MLNKNLLFISYEISGMNLGYLLSELHRKKINVFNILQIDNKTMNITIDFTERKKLFAICKRMCYNILEVGKSGKFKYLYSLYKNIGILIGSLIFVLSLIYFNNIIFSINLSGDSLEYRTNIETVLENNNISKFSKFSLINFKNLEKEILNANKNISFVSVSKWGNRLIIDTIKVNSAPSKVDDKVRQLIATNDGVVQNISVLRGKAVVKIGDTVKKGDLLVDGYMELNGQQIPTYTLASVSLKCEYIYYYESVSDSENYVARAVTLAKLVLSDKEIFDYKTLITKKDNNFIITVHIYYEEIINGG